MITFIPLQEIHLPLLLSWLNQPHVKKWWDSDVVWTYERVVQKYGHRISGIDCQRAKPIVCLIILCDQKPIGYVQYYNIRDFENELSVHIKKSFSVRCASFDIFIGEPDYCGKGLGSEAVKKLIKEYLVEHFEAVCVWAEKENVAAVKAYQKADLRVLTEEGKYVILWKQW